MRVRVRERKWVCESVLSFQTTKIHEFEDQVWKWRSFWEIMWLRANPEEIYDAEMCSLSVWIVFTKSSDTQPMNKSHNILSIRTASGSTKSSKSINPSKPIHPQIKPKAKKKKNMIKKKLKD